MHRLVAAALAALLAAPASVLAAPDAGAILTRVDAVARQSADVVATVKLTVVEPDGTRAERRMKLWQKGTDHRMAKFVAPAKLRGVGLLSKRESKDEDPAVFLYLPAFGRVRRVVGRSRGDSFFGTVFTQDDMGRITYGDRFTPKLAGEDDGHWTLRLDPKKPDDEPYHHLLLKVRRADHVVAGVDIHEKADGGPARRLTASDVQTHGKQPLAHDIEAKDLASGRRTVLHLEEVKTDTGLEDDFFTKRYLKRSPR